jgi:hypothetical protein
VNYAKHAREANVATPFFLSVQFADQPDSFKFQVNP